MHLFHTFTAVTSLLCVIGVAAAVVVPSPRDAASAVAARPTASALYGESYADTDAISEAAGLDCGVARASVFAACAKEMPGRDRWDVQTNSVTTAYAGLGYTVGVANARKRQCQQLAESYGITNISAWTQGLGHPERDVQTGTDAGTDADAGTGAMAGTE